MGNRLRDEKVNYCALCCILKKLSTGSIICRIVILNLWYVLYNYFVTFVVLVVTVQFRPFTANILYRMDVISSLIAIFTLLSGMLYLETQDVNTYDLSVCIVFINLLMVSS